MREAPLVVRGHHLHCMLTFVGKGYSPAFVAAMQAVVARIGEGEPFALTDGPDAICAALDHDPSGAGDHCRLPHNQARDVHARARVERALGRTFGSIAQLTPNDLDTMRRAFTHDADYRSSCEGCEWHPLCTEIAASDFALTILRRKSSTKT